MVSKVRQGLGVRTVRSQLIAGTAAIVGASAITMSGVNATNVHAPAVQLQAAASVELAAFASPLLEIFDTIQRTNLYLFSIAEPPATQFDRAGLIPDFLAAGFPILTQYFLNAPDYINQTINYAFQDFVPPAPTPSSYPGALRVLTWAVDALPANIGYAAQQVFSGNLVGALQTMQFAIGNPVQAALYQTLNAGLYVLGGVGARAAEVGTAIAEWVPTTIRNIADDVTVIMNAAANVVSNVVYGIQTLNIETVWNSLVVGLLGHSPDPATPTIPDALVNQTIGEGGRIYPNPGQPDYIDVPSFRENQIDLRDSITDALATDVPVPEDPPYPVTFTPYQSEIPTPWNPTPGPVPVAAAAAAAVASGASTATASVDGLSVGAISVGHSLKGLANRSDSKTVAAPSTTGPDAASVANDTSRTVRSISGDRNGTGAAKTTSR